MAINFTDSPADGATQVIGGRTYTYNSAKNKWDTTATEVVGPTATVYATVNDLPGTATAGDQAFVSGTNRLYIWNGSGWYNIALVNNTPTWTTQPSSSYELASDGTATTITIVATDPEGLPITYSIASDTSGNIATVTQGTGLSANTFTITPSTSDADAGTFSLTFRATDGINVASAISSFELVFRVVNSSYTTALITSVGDNNAVNNTFVDSSSFNRTITTYGNATQTTFSPYRHGGYSTYFDGSGDYLQPAGTTIFDISSSTASFTVEAWINPPALPSAGAYNYRFGGIISKGVVYVSFGFTNNGTLRFYTYSGVENYINSASGVIEAGKWQHVALVSDAGSITLYKDGVSVATGTLVAPQAAGTGIAPKIAVADTGQASDYINSYVSDLRVVDGTAVYTADFTPPTERLTAITNTSLLTCHLPYIADGSTNGHAITVTGNIKTEAFAPYDYLKYDASINGGSMYFDGTGDYSTVAADTTNLTLNGDFTIDFWVYPTTSHSSSYVFGKYNNNTDGWGIFVTTDWSTGNLGSLTFYYGNYGQNESATNLRDQKIKIGQWSHCRITRESNVFYMAINGVVGTRYNYNTATLSWSDSRTFSADTPIGIGGVSNIPAQQGVISDLRVIKGTALTTTNFTPPTAPLTAVTNTSLLVNGTNAGIIDKSQSIQTMTLNGDVKSSTTQSKYLTSSMYFDGTDDYISAPYSSLFDLGTQDFTVELWVNFSVASGNIPLVQLGQGGSNASTSGWTLMQHGTFGGLTWYRYNGSSETYYVKSWSPSTNTWYHVAVSRQGTDLRFFVDGTSIGTQANVSTSYNNINTSDDLWIGRNRTGNGSTYLQFNGYMSDVRITKGLARYTANFTPPTAALQG